MNELVFSEVNLIGTLAYCDDHPATIGLLRDGKVDAAQFITGRIALDDLVSRVWVPEILCTSCDLLVLVDKASESGPPPDAVRRVSRELGEERS